MESVETQEIIYVISEVIDFAGVVIIALSALVGVILCAQDLLRQERALDAYSFTPTARGRAVTFLRSRSPVASTQLFLNPVPRTGFLTLPLSRVRRARVVHTDQATDGVYAT